MMISTAMIMIKNMILMTMIKVAMTPSTIMKMVAMLMMITESIMVMMIRRILYTRDYTFTKCLN